MARLRFLASAALPVCAALVLVAATAGSAGAQWPPQGSPQALPPPPSSGGGHAVGSRHPMCQRLEAQLASLDRGQGGERAEQIRRYEEAADRQQRELDRMNAQSQRQGCGRGFFLFGGGQTAQCDQINAQIQRMRSNLDSINSGLRRLQSAGFGGDEEQRRTVLASLAQHDCGPQYRTAARPRGFLDQLFGGGTIATPETAPSYQTSAYRTLCVRTCDGYFFPISFSTSPDRFEDDERTCQRMCPAAEVMLFTHRNPGEEVAQSVSTFGQSYTELPNAFRYQKEFDAACTCRSQNASWADAIAEDETLERGDIVVTEDRARALSQPRQGQPSGAPAQNRGRASGPTSGTAAAMPSGAPPALRGAAPPMPPTRGGASASTSGTGIGTDGGGQRSSAQGGPSFEEPASGPAPRAVGPQFYR